MIQAVGVQGFLVPVQGEPCTPPNAQGGLNIENDEVFESIQPVVKRLSRQIERTLEYYAMNFKEEVGKIYFSCQTNVCRHLLSYIYSQLEIPIETIDPFHSRDSESDAISYPESVLERGSFAPVVGAALSDNKGTNLLFTYRDKETVKKVKRINTLMFIIFFLLISLGMGTYYWQSVLFKEKKKVFQELEAQTSQYGFVSEKMLWQEIAKLKQEVKTLKAGGKKYLVVSLIKEISEHTPPEIRLLDVRIAQGGIKGGKDARVITIEGMVLKNPLSFETVLANYLNDLKASQIIAQPVIQNKSVRTFQDQEVLNFILNVAISLKD
jgi:hypothetical protein